MHNINLMNVREMTYRQTHRIFHQSQMQTEKSQHEGKQIMPETRFTEFLALPVDRGHRLLSLQRRPMIDYFSLYILLEKLLFYNNISVVVFFH